MSIEDKEHNFTKIVAMLNYMISSRFHSLQRYTLPILGVFFEKINAEAFPFLENIIKDLIVKRYERPQDLWEKCISKLINSVGAGKILLMAPISLAGDP